MASVNKKFVVGNGLQVGDSALLVDTSTNITGIGSTQPTSTLDVSGDVKVSGVTTSLGGFVGTLTGDVIGTASTAGTATTATNATNITLSAETSDTTCFPIFATDATGNQSPKTDGSKLSYNSSTGNLSAQRFAGELTGNVNATGVSTITQLIGDNIVITGIITAGNFSGIPQGVFTTGVGTVAFLQATTANVSAAATIPTLSGTTATFTRVTANGGFTGNINATGVSTVAFLQATNVNISGIITAGTFSGIAQGVNTSGVGTVAFLQSTTVNVSAGATFGGNVRVNSFGVGTNASGTTGEIRATNDITAFYSDQRLKENIEVIESALDKVCQLHGVFYNSNEIAYQYGYTDKKRRTGVLAQEVQKVLPEAVVRAPFDTGYDENGNEYSISGQEYLTVHYEKIVPLLIEAIKELKDIINK